MRENYLHIRWWLGMLLMMLAAAMSLPAMAQYKKVMQPGIHVAEEEDPADER